MLSHANGLCYMQRLTKLLQILLREQPSLDQEGCGRTSHSFADLVDERRKRGCRCADRQQRLQLSDRCHRSGRRARTSVDAH